MTAAAKAKSGTHWRRIIALTLFAGLMLAALALANSGRAAIETPPPPSVWSDKADYAPGEQVALSGANWAPGESVHIRVNDDAGETWRRDVDVTADESGAISDQFNLPDWFVAQYSVTATGASSGTATWSFTDGNIKVKSAGGRNFGFTFQGFDTSTDCTTGGGATQTGTGDTNGQNVSSNSGQSALITANLNANSPNGSARFVNWSNPDGATITVGSVNTRTICVAGFSSNSKDLIGNYAVPPTANGQSVTTNEDTPKPITLSGSDPGSANLTFSVVSGPANGTLGSIGTVTCAGTSPRNCTANVTYTPNANYNGADSFSFKVNNGTQDSSAATVSITVNPVNDAPNCSAVSLTTDEDTPGDANPDCTDIDSASLSYAIVGAASHGTASILAGKLHYVPNANYNGSDSFTYKANDGALDSNTATVSVTVNPVNDAPVASAQSATTAEDTSKTVTLTGTDVDGDSLDFKVTSLPANGKLYEGTDTTGHLIAPGELPYLVSAADKVTFDPNLNYNGSDSFNFKAYDGALDSAAAAAVSITVTEVNDAPDAVDDSASVAEDGNTLVDVLGNDSTGPANESGQALTITDVSTPAHGTAVVQSGKVKYTPNADYNGSDSFTYTATDDGTTNGVADPKSDTATVSVTVTEVNDAPTAVADSKTIAEDGTLSFPASDLTANDSAGPANESGQTLTVISVDPITGQTHGSVSLVAGTITYTPDPDFNGLAKFDYTVQDNGTTNGAPDFKTGTVYVNVTVTEVNDAPTANDDSKTVAEDGTPPSRRAT